MVQNKKAELAIKDLLSRQDYLVVQGNDLAKAFEKRLLDLERKTIEIKYDYDSFTN